MWSHLYDREPTSLLGLQQELSAAIAEQIRLRLSPTRRDGLDRRQTRNADAYDAYLRGRYQAHRRTAEGNARAIELFKQAIAIDENYALAWSDLGFVFVAGTINGDNPVDVAHWPQRCPPCSASECEPGGSAAGSRVRSLVDRLGLKPRRPRRRPWTSIPATRTPQNSGTRSLPVRPAGRRRRRNAAREGSRSPRRLTRAVGQIAFRTPSGRLEHARRAIAGSRGLDTSSSLKRTRPPATSARARRSASAGDSPEATARFRPQSKSSPGWAASTRRGAIGTLSRIAEPLRSAMRDRARLRGSRRTRRDVRFPQPSLRATFI